jgi:aspartate ammonia-lyase
MPEKNNRQYRKEQDMLGEDHIPSERYYGIHTQRALNNFPITGVPISHFPELIKSLACIKKAAAQANHELGLLSEDLAGAIGKACDEIIAGAYMKEFVVDVIQGGGGTSTNMNANEVIANRALEILGYKKGRYDVLHPNTHVNMSQSTNDVYPSALRLALHFKLGRLINSLGHLSAVMGAKAEEFTDVIKIGRTELQDAVPMTLGQEFAAYALMVQKDMQRLAEARDLIREINLGATAIGTGINCHPDYASKVVAGLCKISGVELETAVNLIEATQDTGAYVQLSGVLKRLAVKISKICNDLRLLSSGPRGGLNEINLPRVQAGSSIMPGKVNPVIPDVVNEVAFQVIGSDVAVTMAAEAGQLELNAMEPIIAYNLFQSIDILERACRVLADRCISGITANRERCRQMAVQSLSLSTALTPIFGYDKASQLAKKAYDNGKSIAETVFDEGLLGREELEQVLSLERMVTPKQNKDC